MKKDNYLKAVNEMYRIVDTAYKPKKALFFIAMLVLIASPTYAWSGSAGYRCPIITNSTSTWTIPVNGTGGVGGAMVWAGQTNNTYIYASNSACTNNIYIGSDISNVTWYFAVNRTGNSVYNTWNQNAIGIYHWDENTGTTVYDLSQYMNNATLNNSGAWVTGLYATGFNSTIPARTIVPNISQNVFNNNSFTILLWVKPKSDDNSYRVLLDKGTEGSNRRIAIYRFPDAGSHHLAYRIYGSGGSEEVTGTNISDAINFHLVGIIRNVSDGKLYGFQDGDWDGTPETDTAGNIGASTETFKIGTNSAGGENYQAIIDSVQFYNYSMTLNELRNIYWMGLNNFSRIGSYEAVTNATSVLLWIDNAQANITTACTAETNHNYTASNNVTGLNVSILYNGTHGATNTTTVNWYASLIAGYWNITANYSGNDTFLGSSKTLFHNITIGNATTNITVNWNTTPAVNNTTCVGVPLNISCTAWVLEDSVDFFNNTAEISNPYYFTPTATGVVTYRCGWNTTDCYSAGNVTRQLEVLDCSGAVDVSNLTYTICSSNTTLHFHDAKYINGTSLVFNDTYTLCEYDCDNVSSPAVCNPPTYQQNLVGFGIFIVFMIVMYIVLRRL